MKKLAFSTLVLLALVLVAGQGAAQSFGAFGFGERDTRTLLVLKADGSCALTNEAVEPRRTLEMQVNSWARYAEMEDNLGTDQDEGPSAPPTTKPSQKKLTDEELSSKVRQMYERRSEFGQDEEMNVAKVEVSTNSVRIVTGRSFASLAELLSQSPYSWGPNVLMFEDARFEIDTNHNLRINFIPSKEATRYAKNLARGWKSSKMKFEWRLVLPGKILAVVSRASRIMPLG